MAVFRLTYQSNSDLIFTVKIEAISMFRNTFCAAAFVAVVPTLAAGNEIDGFRLGMTIEQVLKVAAGTNYKLGNAIKGGPNWTSYVLLQEGPLISFCGNVLSSVHKTSDTNLHEFTHTLERWTNSAGAPDEATGSQRFVEGAPFSDLGYRWVQGNVRSSLSFFQVGTGNLRMSYGYSYVNHPCRSSTR